MELFEYTTNIQTKQKLPKEQEIQILTHWVDQIKKLAEKRDSR